MKKILKSIGDYYKYIYQQMGKLIFLFLPIFCLITFGAIQSAVEGYGLLPLWFVIFLTVVYHVAFIVDKKKTEKRLKRLEKYQKK